MGNREYSLKQTGLLVYKWKPETNLIKSKPTVKRDKKYFCTAKPFTNGFDFITTYSYNISIENNEQVRIAYVECDYVQ